LPVHILDSLGCCIAALGAGPVGACRAQVADFGGVVDLVLKVKAGAYYIEMGNPRHEHEWLVWEGVKVPTGRKLIPGVISHSTNVVEHPELVAERIVRIAKLVGRENVMGGTDCGFAQTPLVKRVHPSIMWAKLETLAAGARLASRELWGRRAAC
jgi:5-methyltetrahydropteroyltriglutamate--homocysteine methyltransferase